MTEMSRGIAVTLRGGVIASGMLMLGGILINVLTGDTSCPTGRIELSWIILGDPFLSASHVKFIGFLVLLSTPLLRIVYSVYSFSRIKDRMYVVLTTLVLIVLLASILLGIEK
jgi:uncharacterized membrane protein